MSAKFWNEECFDLTCETLVDKAMELKAVGGTYGGNNKATPFLCLILKMLQLNPSKDIIIEFINNQDFKYMSCLGAYYIRLTGHSVDVYKYLEHLYVDYRKIRFFNKEGKSEIIHVDEFIDLLFNEERVCDIILPRLVLRTIYEESGELGKRVSLLEEELQKFEETEPSPPRSGSKEKHRRRSRSREKHRSRSREKHRSSSREKHRSRSREKKKHKRTSKERKIKKFGIEEKKRRRT